MSRRPALTGRGMEICRASLAWHGWGSPVGLGIVIVSLGVAAVLFRLAILGL